MHQSPLQIVQQQNPFLSNQLNELKQNLWVSPKKFNFTPSLIPVLKKWNQSKNIPSDQPEILNVLNQDAVSFATLCICPPNSDLLCHTSSPWLKFKIEKKNGFWNSQLIYQIYQTKINRFLSYSSQQLKTID